MKQEFFVCDCTNNDHLMVCTLDESVNELSFDIRMNPYMGFFRRLLTALRFLFKISNNYCHWDNIIFSQKDARRLQEILNQFQQKDNVQVKSGYLRIVTEKSIPDVVDLLEKNGVAVDSIRSK